MTDDIADVATDAALTVSQELIRVRTVVREVMAYAHLKSKDASLEMHERASWRKVGYMCQRALGDG